MYKYTWEDHIVALMRRNNIDAWALLNGYVVNVYVSKSNTDACMDIIRTKFKADVIVNPFFSSDELNLVEVKPHNRFDLFEGFEDFI